MVLSLWQNLALIILAFMVPVDKYGFTFGLRWPVITAMIAGAIVGDMNTALIIGGTLQLMSLGVASIGGSNVPEYGVGAVIGVAIGVSSGSVESGLAIGIPVAMLMVQFDVIAKISQSVIVRLSQDFCNKKKFKEMNLILMCGPFIMGLTAAVPVGIALLIGADVVNAVLAAMPQWFTGGLSIASKMLPVVGVALLLNYMPAKKYLPAILLGYFLVAFMNISMLGVAIVSAIIAMVFYAYKNESSNTVVNGGLEDE